MTVTIESDDPQEKHGDLYKLSGNVVITEGGRTVRADHISYDGGTGEITADGHLELTSSENDEVLRASRGRFNLRSGTGTFYDVSGSTGVRSTAHGVSYSNENPFLFSGRMVQKTGPTDYVLYDGSVTSCLLPHPDWQLFAGRFVLDDRQARAKNSTFRILNVPVLYLPYVTHPIDPQARQAGLLIPLPGHTSTKGYTLGIGAYIPIGRSAEATLGLQYYSMRGFGESGTFRYRGVGNDFLTAHFSALQDRGYYPSPDVYVDQGGQDVTASFRRRFTDKLRAVGDAEYLSSYVYREAFTESFNQAVSSDITSIAYLIRQSNGYSVDGRADRYQGLKRVSLQTPAGFTPGQEVHILHVPSLDFDSDDHRLGKTPLLWRGDSSFAGLKRVQPNFVSGGIIQRLDLRPELALPLSGGGWHTLTSAAVRETLYSRSRQAQTMTGVPPTEVLSPINRASLELAADIRPPVLERDFHPGGLLRKLLGTDVRHTIEPEVTYRYTTGIGNFLQLLRFDDNDVDSNTNELEYGVTQRLFTRARPQALHRSASAPNDAAPCVSGSPPEQAAAATDTDANSVDANGIPVAVMPEAPIRTHAHHAKPCKQSEPAQREWFSWRLAQKYFFDPTFGNAVLNSRRNIFSTTLDFSGIAFLTEPREISPLISRLRVRSSEHTDVEWDFDLDTGAKRFTSNNVYVDAHEGNYFGGLSYARLNAPGRFYTVTIDNNNQQSLLGSAVSDFSQLRILLGYGQPAKPGLSIAANTGLDLKLTTVQYGALQVNYNWNCCGLAVEYRKYELGNVRNENAYKFNFTLANIGTAGNLRRQQSLF